MNESCNILITSISRKVWLVKSFRNALEKEGVTGKIITTDINPQSAGLYLSDDSFISPLTKDDRYISFILDLCKKEDIKLIIPTRDAELLIFASNQNKFLENGIFVNISSPESIQICTDKYLFFQKMKLLGFLTPPTFLPEDLVNNKINYPVIIKSRTGSGSKGIEKIENGTELHFYLDKFLNPIIQEFITGKEYTIDILSDQNNQVISVVPRERIETVCGESYKGKTVNNPDLIQYAKDLTEKLNLKGHITIQCIIQNNQIYVIEINPRFGGGAMLGIQSGADTPLFLIKMALGEKIHPIIGEFEENLLMLRYTEDLFIPENETF